jgi:hypothetical protein
MEKLTKSEQYNINKMSDARLVSCLTKFGVSVDEIEQMDRNSITNKWAELVAAKTDKPATVTVGTVGYDAAVEREKLQFEKFKFEQELKFRVELETVKTDCLRMTLTVRGKQANRPQPTWKTVTNSSGPWTIQTCSAPRRAAATRDFECRCSNGVYVSVNFLLYCIYLNIFCSHYIFLYFFTRSQW